MPKGVEHNKTFVFSEYDPTCCTSDLSWRSILELLKPDTDAPALRASQYLVSLLTSGKTTHRLCEKRAYFHGNQRGNQ